MTTTRGAIAGPVALEHVGGDRDFGRPHARTGDRRGWLGARDERPHRKRGRSMFGRVFAKIARWVTAGRAQAAARAAARGQGARATDLLGRRLCQGASTAGIGPGRARMGKNDKAVTGVLLGHVLAGSTTSWQKGQYWSARGQAGRGQRRCAWAAQHATGVSPAAGAVGRVKRRPSKVASRLGRA